MNILFRPVAEADRSAMADIMCEVDSYFNSLMNEPVPGMGQRALEQMLDLSMGDDPLCDCLVAEQDGRLLGYLASYFGAWERERALYIAGLFVRSEARSKGLGQAFMKKAHGIAAARQASILCWEVWDRNPRAVEFYLRQGAQFTSELLMMNMPVKGTGK